VKGRAKPTTTLPVVYSRASYSFNPSKKVAIIGFASSSRNLAPFDDPSFEIWGLNSLYVFLPRWDRWFEIHPKAHFMKDLKRGELQMAGLDHYKWLQDQPGPDKPKHSPIYMQEAYPEIPASVKWPRDEINRWTTAMFGPQAELDYFTSTPGEMVATAIYEGYGEIHLYGVDLLQDEEYAYQRPSCEYWLGIARGLGISVYVPPASALLKANYVYGYTEPAVEFGTLKPLVTFFEQQNAKMEQAQVQVAASVNAVQGARQAFGAVMERVGKMKDAEMQAYLQAELVQLEQKFKTGVETLNKIGAQREFAASAASWTGAWGRGDKLEGM